MMKILAVLNRTGLAAKEVRMIRFLPWGVIFCLLCLYLSTMSLYPEPGDSMELTTAALSLGVAHPTGYPLYVLLGKIFSIILFFIKPFTVMNLLSTLYFVAALIFIYLSLKKINVSPLAISTSLLLLGVSPAFWHYTSIAEVYTLSALMFSIVLFSMIYFQEKPGILRLCAVCFFAFLSMGNHMTSVLALPGLGVWVIWMLVRHFKDKIKWQYIVYLMIVSLLGASVIFLFFIFDNLNAYNYVKNHLMERPEMQMNAVQRFFWLTSAEEYHTSSFFTMLFSKDLFSRIGRTIARMLEEDNPFLTILGLISLVLICIKRRTGNLGPDMKIFLLSTLVLSLLFFSSYLWSFESAMFMMGHVIMGFSIAVMMDWYLKIRWTRIAFAAVVFTFCIFLAAINYGSINKPLVDYKLDTYTAFFDTVEDDAVIICGWFVSPYLYYNQYVRKKKPNVLVLTSATEFFVRNAVRFPGRMVYFEQLPDYNMGLPLGFDTGLFQSRAGFYYINSSDLIKGIELAKQGGN